jgi:UDP-N-acetylmuramoylalanine--D-glutamate ligase
MDQTIAEFFKALAGKRVAFIGAGVSHQPCIQQFVQHGAIVTLCDKKPNLAAFGAYAQTWEQLGVRLSLGENYLDGLQGQDMIMRTPGFEYFTPELQAAKAAGTEVTSEMELFFALCPCPIVAVTGSDGKTTTTTLIAEMLKAAGNTVHLGGNLGRALLPVVEDIAPTDTAVVELSSFQLISMRRSPDVAVVTNVTPNHLDHHKDMQEYIDAKRNILLYQAPNSRAVLGYENDVTRAMAADVKGSFKWFSRFSTVEEGGFLREDGMLCVADGGVVTPIVHKSEVALRGEHNLENLLAAFCAVWGMVDVSCMAQVARTFKGVEHRIEPVRTLDGVQWFNDSIATSPTRVMAGLRAFAQKLIIIAGGSDKGISFAPLAPELIAHVKVLILTGATADKIEAAVKADPGYADSGMQIVRAQNMEQAVQAARAAAKPGDIVSLSPACASFDSYVNFEARGRHYKELVNAL